MSYAQSGRRVTVSFSLNGGQQSPLYNLEVADDDRLRAKGLMFRKPGDLADNEGMFFAFPEEKKHTFWMKNTYIPLDIIFISRELVVMGVLNNIPVLNEQERSIDAKSRYVIELPAGSAQKAGVVKGARVKVVGSVPVGR